jgi:S1/P1 Nuclease
MRRECADAGLRRSNALLKVGAMISRIFLTVALLLGGVAPARAWGKLGHEAIGALATDLLKEKTRLRVKKILGPDDLGGAATWLDEVRAAERGRGPLVGNAEAAAFAKKFPEHHKWHFVNLPLGAAAYVRTSRFASEDDVVHALDSAIAVLEGRSRKFPPAQALRIVAHLVGDLHQPLHVGTGFFDVRNPAAPKLLTDPGTVAGKPDDLGGNKIQLGHTSFETLHAYWDATLAEAAGSTANAEKLAARLRPLVSAAKWATPGDRRAWPELWATDSLRQAELAYRGIAFTGAKLSEKKSLETIEAKLPADYEKTQRTRAAAQLAKAAFHLAELLNALDWKTP